MLKLMQTKLLRLVALVASATALLAVPASAATVAEQVQGRLLHATAWVITTSDSGSGFVIDRNERLLVTNYHVVKEHADASVVFPVYDKGQLVSDREYYWKKWKSLSVHGKVLVRNKERDLAVIRLEELPEGVEAVALAEFSAEAGATVYRMGSPAAKGEVWKLTEAEVRTVRRQRLNYPSKQELNAWMLLSDVEGRLGDSGAPVVNARGELVAVHAAGDTGTSALSYGIDVREVREVLESARSARAVVRAD
jgi:S1-C subfamily serine protease